MATKISKDAEKILSGVDQATRDYAMANAQGNRLTSGEATRLISSFKTTGSPYSASNISSSVSNPLSAPNLNDPYGLQSSIYSQSGVLEAQNPYLEAVANLRNFDQSSLNQQNTLESGSVPLELIRGRQADQARLRSAQRQGLAVTAETLRDAYLAKKEIADQRYQVALNERSTLTNLIANNPGAKITYSDTPATAATKIENYRVVQEKQAKKDAEQAKKDKYKDALKASLMSAGLKTKGNTKALEKRLRKYNKSEVSDAKKLADLEYKIKLKEYNKPDTSGTDKDTKEMNAFYDDAASLRKEMEAGSANWAVSWNTLNNKYPGLTADAIDNALGLDNRKKYDK